jgi:ABC-type glycerol-3-phosphate transport system permease component
MKKRGLLADIATYVILLVSVFFALFPVYWTFLTSLKTRRDSFAVPPKFFGFDATFDNYTKLFADPTFMRVYANTILVTVQSTALVVILGSFAAYALARSQRFAGRRPLEVSLILLRAMPAVVLIVPLYELASKLGLLGKMPTLVIVYAVFALPFAIWIMTPFFVSIPLELEESAQIDGANKFQIFTRVVLPLAMPGLAATAIFVALLEWNEFLVPVVLGSEKTKTLPVLISGFISARTLDWGPMAAASSLAIIPIVIITVIVQRRLISGLSAGALKD